MQAKYNTVKILLALEAGGFSSCNGGLLYLSSVQQSMKIRDSDSEIVVLQKISARAFKIDDATAQAWRYSTGPGGVDNVPKSRGLPGQVLLPACLKDSAACLNSRSCRPYALVPPRGATGRLVHLVTEAWNS